MMMPTTPLKELYNLRRYILHLTLECEYDFDNDDVNNPLNDTTGYFKLEQSS